MQCPQHKYYCLRQNNITDMDCLDYFIFIVKIVLGY
jgi:hypothetical protein